MTAKYLTSLFASPPDFPCETQFDGKLFADGRSRSSASRFKRVLTTVVLILGVVVLITVAREATGPDLAVPSNESEETGTIVRGEWVEIWLPESCESLRGPFDEGLIESHESLKKRLDAVGETNLWYVALQKGQLANGDSQTWTFVRQPYMQPQCFEEFRAILAGPLGKLATRVRNLI